MSYDLSFWNQTGTSAETAVAIQRRLLDGESVDGVEELAISEMRDRTAQAFADWTRTDDDTWATGANGEPPAFQLFTTPQLFHVTCYGLDGDQMNRFVDLCLDFACPLFDPQTGERFG